MNGQTLPRGAQGTLRAGLSYIGRGWPVVLLHHATSIGSKKGPDRARCSCGDTACTSQGKHPRTKHGLEDATLDPQAFARALNRWPDANLGVRTGIGFDVLDIDSEAADLALGEVARAAGARLESRGPMVRTGRGWQLYWQPTGHGNAVGLVPDADWRGRGGYVICPPSVHHTGAPYQWEVGCGPEEPLEPAPSWLTALLSKPSAPAWTASTATGAPGDPYVARAIEGEAGRVALAPEGQRNHELNRASFNLGTLVGAGRLDPGTAAAALLTAAQRAGLGQREAEATIASGLRSGIANPRKAAA